MYTAIEDDLKSLNTAMCVLHPKYQEALKRIQKLVESKLKSPDSHMVQCCKCGEEVEIDKQKYHCKKCFNDIICPLLKTCEFYQQTSFFELTDFTEKSKLNKQSVPLCECGRPLVNKLVCSDRNCQHTSW